MNKVILIGRLTKDPAIRHPQDENDTLFARYTLAVDRRFNKKEGEQNADFISCVAFGKSAEFAEKYLRQGKKIAVSGRLQTGSYTNREGFKVYTTDVIIEEQEFAESKSAASASGTGDSQNTNPNTNPFAGSSQNTDNTNTDAFDDGFMNIPDDIEKNLPF